MHASRTDELQPWIDRLQSGDDRAREELLVCARERLKRLTRKMLQSFPGVRCWEETDDVLQNAMLRLHSGMQTARFETVLDFLRFASVLIRRELIDLSRHYLGPEGHGRHHAQTFNKTDSLTSDRLNPGTDTHEPSQLSNWTEFHEEVERLEDDLRAVFDLLWYQELSQADAAQLLGVSERTVQRRWQSARLKLHELMHQPEDGLA